MEPASPDPFRYSCCGVEPWVSVSLCSCRQRWDALQPPIRALRALDLYLYSQPANLPVSLPAGPWVGGWQIIRVGAPDFRSSPLLAFAMPLCCLLPARKARREGDASLSRDQAGMTSSPLDAGWCSASVLCSIAQCCGFSSPGLRISFIAATGCP